MPNFYTDNPDLLHHLRTLDLKRVIDLREDGFTEVAQYPEAPKDQADAVDNYHRVMEIVGDIAGNFIAPRAPEVDRVGAHCENGVVTLAPGTQEALDRLAKADLMGFTMPRRYGGLNLPKTLYSMAVEVVSRADASLMNLFGLQDIAETILHFGSEDQRRRFLPRFSSGEVSGAMDLTEPDAGSDLQAVMLRATEDAQGVWRLNGVKRFITNGCARIHLVLARSEEGSTSGTGLSLFIYEREPNLRIRRIEEKLGIHGSPTCELQFRNSPCELLGRRKYGLIRYTMSLMNGARLGIAAQSLGIAEAAYREALGYARDREQFKRPIDQFLAIREMLSDMRVNLAACRTLVLETSRMVDIKEGLEEKIEHHPERKADLDGDLKRYTKLVGLFTPLAKAYGAELANRITYDAIQIHGGVGFTREFNVERHYRDARITSIYEGTTQLQVVAAIGGVTGGVLTEWLTEIEEDNDFTAVAEAFATAKGIRACIEDSLAALKGRSDFAACIEYHARRLVDMAADCANAYLLCKGGIAHEARRQTAWIYARKALARAKGSLEYIRSVPACP